MVVLQYYIIRAAYILYNVLWWYFRWLHRGSNCRPMGDRSIISSCQSAATSEIVKRFWSQVELT